MVLAIGPQNYGTQQTATVSDKAGGKGDFAPVIAVLPKQLSAALISQLSGQTTAAKILSFGAGNTATLEVRGKPLEVTLKGLPAGQGAGDTLLINFQAEDGEANLQAQTVSGKQVSAGLLNKSEAADALTPSSSLDPKTVQTGSTTQQLSDTARLLGALTQLENSAEGPLVITVGANPATDANSDAANVEGGGETLLNKTELNAKTIEAFTTQLVKNMATAIEQSGLFYEAHLEEWSTGERSMEDIKSEPQANWKEEDALDEDTPMDSGRPKESAKLVSSQLGMLDRPQMNLSMMGLFNDRVELTIEQEQKRNRKTKEIPAWFATVKMNLPELGPLEMRITMTQEQCNVHLKANSQTRGLIAGALPELNESMTAAGLKLSALAMNDESKNGQR